MKIYLLLPLVFIVFFTDGCGKAKTSPHPSNKKIITRPVFNSDSAYSYIKAQVDMGPRIPQTITHQEAMDYIVDCFHRFGWKVDIEEGKMQTYSGEITTVRNIIAQPDTSMWHHSEKKSQDWILLCSHYDSRPWCDMEEIYEDRFTALPAANDGASGVGVLLEIARQVYLMSLRGERLISPIEIVFFDVEDMGKPNFYTGVAKSDGWCLGSQMWSQNYINHPIKHYSCGILLDMVGSFDATFPVEYFSDKYASWLVDEVWGIAKDLGYNTMFIPLFANSIFDDHYYVNQAGIPCIDIIHLDQFSESGFPFWWHTKKDNMEQISKSTLQAVGEVIMQFVVKK